MNNHRKMEQRSVIVVGGGIGGLAAAAALLARGWQVEVLERAHAFGEVGAGILLWPNALRALDALGVGEPVRAKALPALQAGLRGRSGRWLWRTDVDEMTRRFGPVVMIRRADLLNILATAVPAGMVRFGAEVAAVRVAGNAAEVTHDNEVRRADLVVGADGLRSAVRRALWPDARELRYAGYTAWRLIGHSSKPIHVGGETWGRGERFGFAPLPDGRVYAYAAANCPPGESGPDGELAELRRRFRGWHDPIPALLEAVSEEAIVRHDVFELPPLATYVRGPVALLGDAAHAMTPDTGQGACQALEDAVVLAASLTAHSSSSSALAAYDAARRPRTQWIARRSRRIGNVAQANSVPVTVLRDLVVRFTPSSLQMRFLVPVLSWRPPASLGPRR